MGDLLKVNKLGDESVYPAVEFLTAFLAPFRGQTQGFER
jgi:hypothetical protein